MDLAAQFEARDEAAWRALAEKALKGRSLDALASKTLDQLTLEPLYWSRDEAASATIGGPGAAPFTRGLRAEVDTPAWTICQMYASPDPAETNRQILADLEGGAGAITLRLAAPEQLGLKGDAGAALARALEGVHLDFVPLYLEPGLNFETAADALQALWSERGLASASVSGGIGADPIGACALAGGLETTIEQALASAAALALETANTLPNVTALSVDTRPYHDGGASEAQELACLAATLAAYLRALEAAGLSPQAGLAQISFVLSCDADLFLSIAKLRAARTLLSRIAHACGAEGALGQLRLRAETSQRMMSALDPHVNLLRTTCAIAAAALGGADEIGVLPYTTRLGEPDPLARRIARNSQLVLQEESHLGRVLDAPGGSWYIDSLTRDLAAKAWELFQGIESQGGMAAALLEGRIQADLMESAKARARQVALAENQLIGVNSFPNLAETPPQIAAADVAEPLDDPAVTVEPIPLRAPSQAFERLRGAADAFTAESGARPKLFLANLGRLADFNARANFARNLFAAGGIEASGDEGYETAEAAAAAFKESGARAACICGSDEAYAESAADHATSLKAVGAELIFLAGRPGEARAALKTAGVSAFIHKGCDLLETLGQAHDALGVSAR